MSFRAFRSFRTLMITILAACLMLPVVGSAQAQDGEGGLRGFLGELLERLPAPDGRPDERSEQDVPPPAIVTDNTQVQRRVPLGSADIQLSFAPLVKTAAPAVVNVYAARRVQSRSQFGNDPFFEQFFGRQFSAPPRMQSSLGSGVIVGADGLVVTNNHVIDGADEVKIALADGREFACTVVLRDERSDLAVLQVNGGQGGFPVLAFADSDRVETGDLVLAIGNPFGVGQTITSGIISANARTRVGVSDFGFFLQTDAAINPGNSGGALVDMQGRLVGINTAIFTRSGGSNGIGFAIPANMVRAVVAQARAGSADFDRAYIGAAFESVTPAIAEALGLDRPSGVLVRDVYAGGPAARAGLKAGDVVLSIGGEMIGSTEELGYRLATIGPGNEAQLDVLRRGSVDVVPVLLESSDAAQVSGERVLIGGQGPFAGATIAALTPALAGRLGMAPSDDPSVVIVEIERGSSAARSGFAPGDIVLAINGARLGDVVQAQEAMEARTRSWQFVINRQGRILRQFLRY